MGQKVQTEVKISESKSKDSVTRDPETAPPQSVNSPIDQILAFQKSVGNQAVQKLLKSGALQAKLKSGKPGDKYGQDADRVADALMRIPDEALSRQPLVEEEEEEVQTKPLADQVPPLVQRQGEVPEEKEEEPVQAKEQLGHTPQVPLQGSASIQSLKGAGQPLSGITRSFFESRFDQDFSQVRIHNDAKAASTTKVVNARAFTLGQDIVFGTGEYSSDTSSRRRLLAHELTHVIQQACASEIHVSCNRRHDSLIQRTVEEAEALIDRHTSWGNLDETALGSELLRLALSGQLTLASEVLNELGSTDRDDVAYEFMLLVTDQQLVRLAAATASRQFLHRLFDELTSGSVAAEEQQQADRILNVTASQTVSVGAFDTAATSRRTKIFPFRLPGFTVLDDAPIEARRERGGVWVRTVTRVLGADMFRAETATLPTEYFIGGIVLPETEVIGVRLYDQGGIIHYTTPLFLIQLANATNQRILEKILEAAGIGLTLGTGALAGLGVEASMAARVLLWADRAAFALGTVTSVLREHRSWLVEHFGSGFMDAVDTIHSATIIYGLARVVLQAPRIIQGLRDSYRTFREAARSQSSGFSAGERATIQQVSQNTDDLINQIDSIEGARSVPQARQQPASEVATGGGASAASHQPQPSPPAAAEPTTASAIPRARADIRSVPTVVRTTSGVDVAIDANRLEHVLTAHTVENFNPVARAAEIAGEAPTHLTTFFRRGTVTNARELYTLIRQALQGRVGRNVVAGANNQLLLTLRNHRMEAWVGPAAGGGMRLNSIYPLASTGRNLTAAQIRAYAAEINAGTRTLAQIRAEIANLLELR